MPSDDPGYWFPAKRYGWGWGPPCTWQGWLIFILYFALIIAGIPLVQRVYGDVRFILFVTIATVVLVGICWLTGEPPRWRWGKDEH